jgi:PHP family Zn ribbon phosphoesterase
VLLEAKREDILAVSLPEIAEGIMLVREGKVNIRPGYDGEFGKISIFEKSGQQKKISGQKTLF